MGVCRRLSLRLHITMKLTAAVKKVLRKLNSMIKNEKMKKMERDNFLNESFEEEIEENLQNELLEAKLVVLLAMAPPCQRVNLSMAENSAELRRGKKSKESFFVTRWSFDPEPM